MKPSISRYSYHTKIHPNLAGAGTLLIPCLEAPGANRSDGYQEAAGEITPALSLSDGRRYTIIVPMRCLSLVMDLGWPVDSPRLVHPLATPILEVINIYIIAKTSVMGRVKLSSSELHRIVDNKHHQQMHQANLIILTPQMLDIFNRRSRICTCKIRPPIVGIIYI